MVTSWQEVLWNLPSALVVLWFFWLFGLAALEEDAEGE